MHRTDARRTVWSKLQGNLGPCTLDLWAPLPSLGLGSLESRAKTEVVTLG